MSISTKIWSCNLYVGPRPLTLPNTLPTLFPHLRLRWIRAASPAGRGAANDTVSSTDAGLAEGHCRSWPLPAFPSAHFTLCSRYSWRLAEHILLQPLADDEKFCFVLQPNITARGVALCTFPSSFYTPNLI